LAAAAFFWSAALALDGSDGQDSTGLLS